MTSDQAAADFLDDLAREVRANTEKLAALEQAALEAALGLGTPARTGFDLGAMPLAPGGGPIAPAAVIQPGAVIAESVSAGAVTTDKLAAGAITTAKLDASAVIALVTNTGATVVINAAGITVTGGKITVTNPGGTVVIDGTSNMFKIAASGTLSLAGFGAGATGFHSTSVDVATGFTYQPVVHVWADAGSGSTGLNDANHIDASATFTIAAQTGWSSAIVAGNKTQVFVFWSMNIGGPAVGTQLFRYYILQEVGF